MGNNNFSQHDKSRVDYFLELFSKERKDIRKEISALLPSYNELLDMHALSFEEFALQMEAEKRGINYKDPLFSYDSIMPTCPVCQSHTETRRKQDNLFCCKTCKSKFTANHNSISSGTKCSSIVWLKVLHGIMNFSTIDEICKTADISRTTYFRIRNRLFYGMQLILEDIKLYDVICCDFTVTRASYKGLDLEDTEYPEDSMFYQETSPPRKSKERGGPNKQAETTLNSIVIFTAIDSASHVYTKLIGFGRVTSKMLERAVENDKILLSAPKEDASIYRRNSDKASLQKPRQTSLLVSDKDPVIIAFAKRYGIEHEYHVYRKNGVQLKLPKGAHDIQPVNQLDHKVKKFLRDTNYVSSKYLPGFLVLFDWLQNTKGSQEAILQLFKVLSTPGLGKEPMFYEKQYAVPDYMTQWLDEDNALMKLSKTQMYCYYLCRSRQDAIEAGETDVQTVTQIAEICGMSQSAVRRTYENLDKAGYGPRIMELFEKGNALKKTHISNALDQEFIDMYDDFCDNLRLPLFDRKTFAAYLREYNLRNNTNYNYNTILYYFEVIEKSGVRTERKELLEKIKREQHRCFQ